MGHSMKANTPAAWGTGVFRRRGVLIGTMVVVSGTGYITPWRVHGLFRIRIRGTVVA